MSGYSASHNNEKVLKNRLFLPLSKLRHRDVLPFFPAKHVSNIIAVSQQAALRSFTIIYIVCVCVWGGGCVSYHVFKKEDDLVVDAAQVKLVPGTLHGGLGHTCPAQSNQRHEDRPHSDCYKTTLEQSSNRT